MAFNEKSIYGRLLNTMSAVIALGIGLISVYHFAVGFPPDMKGTWCLTVVRPGADGAIERRHNLHLDHYGWPKSGFAGVKNQSPDSVTGIASAQSLNIRITAIKDAAYIRELDLSQRSDNEWVGSFHEARFGNQKYKSELAGAAVLTRHVCAEN
jgi:hypothetical protein